MAQINFSNISVVKYYDISYNNNDYMMYSVEKLLREQY